MRTARLLTVSQHALPGGVPAGGGVPAQGGGVSARGVYLPRGGGCTCQGVSCPGTPPPMNRMTDRCKNITFPQTSFAGGNNVTNRLCEALLKRKFKCSLQFIWTYHLDLLHSTQ